MGNKGRSNSEAADRRVRLYTAVEDLKTEDGKAEVQQHFLGTGAWVIDCFNMKCHQRDAATWRLARQRRKV